MLATAAPTEPPVFHFSTDHFAESERSAAWQDVVGRRLLKIEIEPLPASRLHCDIKLHAVPGLEVFFGSGSAARFARTSALIDSDDFTFAVCAGGHWHASQRGREAALGRGDAILVAKAEVVTMTMSALEGMMFRVPASALAGLIPDPYALVARPIPPTSSALRLLVGYLGLLRHEMPLMTPELQQLFATHVYDLTAAALGATREAAEIVKDRGVRAARLQAVITEIKQRFADPRLSPAAVAGQLRVSPRYVQDLLQESGVPFTERVIALRLDKARAMLASAAHRHRKIIDIAYSCGFNDLSYFNRCFRRRFGASPTQLRGARID
jgi:AraC-like DNA-binding protein